MSYTAKRVPNEPIVVLTFTPPLDPATDVVNPQRDVEELTKDIPTGHIYKIIDTRATNPTFDEITLGLDQMRRNLAIDPRFVNIVVGTSEMAKLGAQAAKQKQYGEREHLIFVSVEEAVEYAKAEAAKERQSQAKL